MSRKSISILALTAVFLLLSLSNFAQSTESGPKVTSLVETSPSEKRNLNLPQPETIFYTSNGLKLKAYLYKPSTGGPGPFPAYVWNHGSDKNMIPYAKVAKFWTDHGFVFFLPFRSGHGDNPGDYIVDQERALKDEGLRGP